MNNMNLPPSETQAAPMVRYPNQVQILQRAVAGDRQSANLVLLYLSSSITDLRLIMMTAIHDWPHARLWRHLLLCLSLHRWGTTLKDSSDVDCSRRDDPESSHRIDSCLCEVFAIDESQAEQAAKQTVLRLGLASPEPVVRHTAAYLMALRGNKESLPFLEEVIDYGDKNWKLRVISALAALEDERSGILLLRALAQTDKQVHQAASRAIAELGKLARPALLSALEHPNSHVRWHAARGLGAISDRLVGDQRAIRILVSGLLDANQAVSWASASTLAEIGRPAVSAILGLICAQGMTEPLRQTVYHALNAMKGPCRQKLAELVEALSSPTSSGNAPAIASRMLVEEVCTPSKT